jgi:hypothetical protein
MSVSDFPGTLSRRFSTAISQTECEDGEDLEYDLITFLSIAQTLNIFILPLNLPPVDNAIGKGATSKVQSALMSLETIFAFKRIRRNGTATAQYRKAL